MTNDHAVYFYEDDTFLIDNVANFVRTGLEHDETVIVVATEQHRSDLKAQLMTEGVIGLTAPMTGNYVTLDASETLALFMNSAAPDERLFLQVIGQIIGSAAQGRPVRIYGEMVAVLWADGLHKAAIRLEELWNELAKHREFFLLCGYPSSSFQEPGMAKALREVCRCHSQVAGRPLEQIAL
jgi:hypothetical protein